MRSTRPIVLALAAALLAGAAAAEDATPDRLYQERDEFDQRNRIWSMQGVRDGSYTGEATRNRVQTRTREQARTRTQQGPDYASRYGQGYESRQGRGGSGGAPGGGSARSGGGRR